MPANCASRGWCDAIPASSASRTAALNGAQATLDTVAGRRKARPHLLPAVLNLTRLSLRTINVGHRQDRLGINGCFLRDGVSAVLRVSGLVMAPGERQGHLLSGAKRA